MSVRDQMRTDQQVRESRGESLLAENGGDDTPPQPSDPAGPVDAPIGTPTPEGEAPGVEERQ